jgi:hypothetical protein
MADFLFYGDTKRSATMRHELPIEIIDGFLLAIVDGRTHVMVNSLERERVAATAPTRCSTTSRSSACAS